MQLHTPTSIVLYETRFMSLVQVAVIFNALKMCWKQVTYCKLVAEASYQKM